MAENISNIFEAVQIRNVESVRQILAGGLVLESRDDEGRTPLLVAAIAGYDEIVSEILSHQPNLETRDEGGLSALMVASAVGRAEIVSELLRAGALPDGTGTFPKETALMKSSIPNSPNCIKLLLEAGAEVNGQNEAGSTALMTAVHWGNLDCARLLINAGASVNLRDSRGRTALFHAVAASRESMCSILLAAGADPDLKDNSGLSSRKLAESADAAIRKMFF